MRNYILKNDEHLLSILYISLCFIEKLYVFQIKLWRNYKIEFFFFKLYNQEVDVSLIKEPTILC